MNNATIIRNEPVASGIYELALRLKHGAEDILPGQFAHIKVPGSGETLLRRPISVNHVGADGAVVLVYQIKGEGTRRLSGAAPGEGLDVLAPLGRGFWLPEGAERAAVVGGGIGAAPLRLAMEAWPELHFDAFLGFRSADLAYQLAEFDALADRLFLRSDDGSLGERGFVTDALADQLKQNTYDVIYACGPAPMLRALKRVVGDGAVPCQVSLEERMGCGVGACLVCNCRVRTADGWHYRRVCADGPVFELGEVEL